MSRSATTGEVRAAVRAWAQGLLPAEAAVELLIRMPHTGVYAGAPWLIAVDQSGAATVGVDADALVEHSCVWSGGERRVVAIAASLLGGRPVDLADAVSGIDRRHLRLVLAAIAHANGSHHHEHVEFDDTGTITGIGALPALYPWPD